MDPQTLANYNRWAEETGRRGPAVQGALGNSRRDRRARASKARRGLLAVVPRKASPSFKLLTSENVAGDHVVITTSSGERFGGRVDADGKTFIPYEPGAWRITVKGEPDENHPLVGQKAEFSSRPGEVFTVTAVALALPPEMATFAETIAAVREATGLEVMGPDDVVPPFPGAT